MGKIIRRGVVAGLLGGCAFALILLLLGEGHIQSAIENEASHALRGNEETIVSRDLQAVGGAVGAVLIGGALGLVFSDVFAATRHILPGRTDRARGFVLAGIAFVAVYVVPFLKYPPNLPGVGDPETITERTEAYLAAVTLSVLAPIAAWRYSTFVLGKVGKLHVRLQVTVALWALIVVLGLLIVPGPDDGTATSLVSELGVAAGIGAFAMWASIGIAFGWLTSRASA